MTHAERPFDPTDQPELIALRDRARAHLGVDGAGASQPDPPTALVLSGGGGKGAYEAGCMLALWDCELRSFVAAAGTSVGGLNAALFKRLLVDRDRDVVLRVWSELGFSRVLGASPWTVVKLLLYLPINILALQNPLKAVHDGSGAPDIEMARWWDWIAHLVVTFLRAVVPFVVGALTFLAMAVGFAALWSALGLPGSERAQGAFLLLCLGVVPLMCRRASRYLGLADNTPLRRTVESVCSPTLLAGDPEVIVTLATVSRGSSASSYAHYPTLARKTHAGAIDLLVQTAALPEIFPMRPIEGDDYVDGGVEDNTPIVGVYPVQPARVIVVYLDHRYALMLERRRQAGYGTRIVGDQRVWDRDMALKLWEAKRCETVTARRGLVWEGPLRAWFWRLELMPIIPSRSLGNFVTGTLNFSRQKARDLIALGYQDTLNALLAWPPGAR